ncbi:hypothetical protein LJC02_01760 [Breznakia sp. OttesenSCG-928-G09]|nr:hypothetical protein [Breznakia sp. OttesenSCG-928-G09]
MAQRRMFNNDVIDSDAFLDLPVEAQALYFHLVMKADDDGFVNKAKGIARMIGANDNAIDTLVENKYLIIFDSGVVVIKHWLMQNKIRKDRYNATTYEEERALLIVNENESYSLKKGVVAITQPVVNQVETKEEPSVPIESTDYTPIEKEAAWLKFWSLYPNKKDKAKAETKFKKICVNDAIYTEMMNGLNVQRRTADWLKENGRFIPLPTTWLNGKRWQDEVEVSVEEKKKVEVVETMSEEERINLLSEVEEIKNKMKGENV